MEIENLGARCMLAQCRVLDYLPVRCGHCGGTFCTEHQLAGAHGCLAAPSPEGGPHRRRCPECGRDVGAGPGALAAHLRAACKGRVRTDPRCAHRGCGVRDALAVACPQCARMFCLAHRHLEVHGCVRAGAATAPPPPPRKAPPRQQQQQQQQQQQTRRPASPAQKEPARAGRAPRVDFANTPGAPLGDKRIPTDEQVAVPVYFPIAVGAPARHMVFSRRFSAGKIIDDIVTRVPGLPTPAAGKRYHLYAVKSGGTGVNLLPHITPLRDLPTGTLLPGDVLVMETSDAGLPREWAEALAAKPSAGTVSSLFRKQHSSTGSPSRRLLRSSNSDKKKSICTIF